MDNEDTIKKSGITTFPPGIGIAGTGVPVVPGPAGQYLPQGFSRAVGAEREAPFDQGYRDSQSDVYPGSSWDILSIAPKQFIPLPAAEVQGRGSTTPSIPRFHADHNTFNRNSQYSYDLVPYQAQDSPSPPAFVNNKPSFILPSPPSDLESVSDESMVPSSGWTTPTFDDSSAPYFYPGFQSMQVPRDDRHSDDHRGSHGRAILGNYNTYLHALQMELQRRENELKVKEGNLGDREKDLQTQVEELQLKEKDLDAKEKDLETRLERVRVDEGYIEEEFKRLEDSASQLATRWEDVVGKEAEVEQLLREAKDREEKTKQEESELAHVEEAKSAHANQLAAPPTKHSRFWKEDGSVTVQISDTLFCLHRSRLVELSNYFKIIFSEPSLFYDDTIPRYRVNVVSVEDFESLLTILDDMSLMSVFSISFVAAVLRASTALSFPMLRQWANCRLLEIWPSSLHDLSVIEVRSITDIFDVYVLARDMNIPTVFRRASYELARSDFQLLIKPNQYHRELGQQDISRLTYLRDRLLNAWTSVLADDIPCSAWLCLGKDARNGKWMEVVVQSGLYKKRMYDPVMGLLELTNLDWSKHAFCTNCITAKKAVWLKRRQDLWVDVATWIA